MARLQEDGQSNSAPQAINDGISTWHHLLEVLHFVCELRGVHGRGAGRMEPRIKSGMTQGVRRRFGYFTLCGIGLRRWAATPVRAKARAWLTCFSTPARCWANQIDRASCRERVCQYV